MNRQGETFFLHYDAKITAADLKDIRGLRDLDFQRMIKLKKQRHQAPVKKSNENITKIVIK